MNRNPIPIIIHSSIRIQTAKSLYKIKRVRLMGLSFTLTQAGWSLLSGNQITIGNRVYRYFQSRDIEGTPKRCTIKRDAVGDVYICVMTEHEDADLNRAMTGKIAGFD